MIYSAVIAHNSSQFVCITQEHFQFLTLTCLIELTFYFIIIAALFALAYTVVNANVLSLCSFTRKIYTPLHASLLQVLSHSSLMGGLELI